MWDEILVLVRSGNMFSGFSTGSYLVRSSLLLVFYDTFKHKLPQLERIVVD